MFTIVGKALKDTVLMPLLRRGGTALAALLLVGGQAMCDRFEACGLVTQGGADMVVAYLIAVAGLAFDLLLSWLNRVSVAKAASK